MHRRFRSVRTWTVVLAAAALFSVSPAGAERTDVFSGISTDARAESGLRIRVVDRDVLNIVEDGAGNPRPTLNHVTYMLVHDAFGALVCTAVPVTVTADLLMSSVRVTSGATNCVADLTWSSSAPPIPDPPLLQMDHLVIRIARAAGVSGTLRGSSYSGTGTINRDLEYWVQP